MDKKKTELFIFRSRCIAMSGTIYSFDVKVYRSTERKAPVEAELNVVLNKETKHGNACFIVEPTTYVTEELKEELKEKMKKEAIMHCMHRVTI